MHRFVMLACAALWGPASASAQGATVVTMLGVSAPERVGGFVAFMTRRLEDPARGVTFMYTPPLDEGPTVSVEVRPIPAAAGASFVREQIDDALLGWARRGGPGEPHEIAPIESMTITGSDGVRYEGWRSRMRVPGSRVLNYHFDFRKERHLVELRFQDDNLDPVLTDPEAQGFISEMLGGLSFRELPDDLRRLPERPAEPAAARPPAPPPVGPDELLSPSELVRVDDLREAALRWAFANNGSDLHPPAAHCVGGTRGRGSDPSTAFLGRFREDAVPVRPASACETLSRDDNPREYGRHNIVDRETGGFALYFDTGRVAWTGERSAEVGVQYAQGGLWGTGWRCTAEQEAGGAWWISSCQKTVDR
jgi:hypothetical protein